MLFAYTTLWPLFPTFYTLNGHVLLTVVTQSEVVLLGLAKVHTQFIFSFLQLYLFCCLHPLSLFSTAQPHLGFARLVFNVWVQIPLIVCNVVLPNVEKGPSSCWNFKAHLWVVVFLVPELLSYITVSRLNAVNDKSTEKQTFFKGQLTH